MEYWPLEITLVSAHDIEDVNFFSKMDVYAVVSITGSSFSKKQKHKSPVHKGGGTNPKWNHSLELMLDDASFISNFLKLEIQLVSDRTLGDIKIGKVVIPAKKLFQDSGKGEKHVNLLGMRKGRSKGSVRFKYKFGQKSWVQPESKRVQPESKRGGGGDHDWALPDPFLSREGLADACGDDYNPCHV